MQCSFFCLSRNTVNWQKLWVKWGDVRWRFLAVGLKKAHRFQSKSSLQMIHLYIPNLPLLHNNTTFSSKKNVCGVWCHQDFFFFFFCRKPALQLWGHEVWKKWAFTKQGAKDAESTSQDICSAASILITESFLLCFQPGWYRTCMPQWFVEDLWCNC